MFCSYLGLIKWLQNHLLQCQFKKLTGIDCPGCGFQRSVIALLKGQLYESLQLYPATIPILATTLFIFWNKKYPLAKSPVIKNVLYFVTGNVIAVAYIFKIYSMVAVQ